jgi:predicted methyltransferase MtxX (methanogen marker protein 4)
MQTAMLIFSIIGAMVLIASLAILVGYFYDKYKTAKRTAEAQVEVIRDKKEAKKNVDKLTDAELDDLMRKRMQSKR